MQFVWVTNEFSSYFSGRFGPAPSSCPHAHTTRDCALHVHGTPTRLLAWLCLARKHHVVRVGTRIALICSEFPCVRKYSSNLTK